MAIVKFNSQKSANGFAKRVNGTVRPGKQNSKFEVKFKYTGPGNRSNSNGEPPIRPEGMEGPEFDDYAWTAEDF